MKHSVCLLASANGPPGAGTWWQDLNGTQTSAGAVVDMNNAPGFKIMYPGNLTFSLAASPPPQITVFDVFSGLYINGVRHNAGTYSVVPGDMIYMAVRAQSNTVGTFTWDGISISGIYSQVIQATLHRTA